MRHVCVQTAAYAAKRRESAIGPQARAHYRLHQVSIYSLLHDFVISTPKFSREIAHDVHTHRSGARFTELHSDARSPIASLFPPHSISDLQKRKRLRYRDGKQDYRRAEVGGFMCCIRKPVIFYDDGPSSFSHEAREHRLVFSRFTSFTDTVKHRGKRHLAFGGFFQLTERKDYRSAEESG